MTDPARHATMASIPEALAELSAGRMIILVDDEDRENEGDLVCFAEFVTPEIVNFMARHARGLICLPMEKTIADRLDLPLQVERNTSRLGTAFTVSIEARTGVTTGISAADRARTILTAASPDCGAEDLVRPGHIFPLRAMPGGVLRRAGQTEGAVDLARLAGRRPIAVICEIMNDDGTMARMPDLVRFAAQHGLKIASVADLIAHRRKTERLIELVVSIDLPTAEGEYRAHLYRSTVDGSEHLALSLGDPHPGLQDGIGRPVLVRVHSECLTGDVLGSLRCDCGAQLKAAMHKVAQEGEGIVLYMRQQEGRGIGLANKMRAYHLQQTQGLDTVEANRALGLPVDIRDYGVGAQILRDLGVREMRLLTNNPSKYHAMNGYGLKITERVPLQVQPDRHNERYLRTKRDKLGHALDLLGDALPAPGQPGPAERDAGAPPAARPVPPRPDPPRS
ncbi:MAG TPA: bifunctional 3,4-dihydroxy-2-butanone-4-phosphate synthase/GTP cyclohydrolase II [Planctomycetota bacterium]|nr:bifunctional 3,4-dihydroxy-2-butanone-4-phosphate synthase/GTP cyclohydrolase II [Planctomycetota bacterium]